MTRMISLSLLALFALFAAGAITTALYIQKITGGYSELAVLHRGEDIQRKLVISVQVVRSDLHMVRTPFEAQIDSIVENMNALKDAANDCSGCHRVDTVNDQMREVQRLIGEFERDLSYYITASANMDRVAMLKDEAVRTADQILVLTNDMLLQAGNKFQIKASATMDKINNARRFLYMTILLTLASAVFIAVKLITAIKRPVRELLDATKSIASGKLGLTVSYADQSDFGELVRNFNTMSKALHDGYAKLSEEIRSRQQAEGELQKAYDQMEQRVNERTAEIQAANVQLQQEIRDRRLAEEQVKASLNEKDILLKEIHHRVKNNMQVISSLLSFQSDYIEDPQYSAMFLECQNRIKAMSLVHEKLYQSRHIARIDFNDYLRSLAAGLYNFYGADSSKIMLHLDIEDVSFAIDTAIPCGLIVNELLANCLKHAFPETGHGEISVIMNRVASTEGGDDMYELTVKDNGIGLPNDLKIRETSSLGLQIVRILVEHQLQGTLHVDSLDGTSFRMHFRERRSSSIPARIV